jgi:hypothetical protein
MALLARIVRGFVGLLLALVLLFEEWGWRPLAELLALLARLKPIARLEAVIASLPPYAALVVFALPSLLLAPVKLAAVWLLTQGKVLSAGALMIAAKVAGTALVARIFMLTRPALMRLPWFARLYHWVVPWKEAVFARIRASWAWRYGRLVKALVRHEWRMALMRWRPALDRLRIRLAPTLQAWRLRARLLLARLRRRLGRRRPP